MEEVQVPEDLLTGTDDAVLSPPSVVPSSTRSCPAQPFVQILGNNAFTSALHWQLPAHPSYLGSSTPPPGSFPSVTGQV